MEQHIQTTVSVNSITSLPPVLTGFYRELSVKVQFVYCFVDIKCVFVCVLAQPRLRFLDFVLVWDFLFCAASANTQL